MTRAKILESLDKSIQILPLILSKTWQDPSLFDSSFLDIWSEDIAVYLQAATGISEIIKSLWCSVNAIKKGRSREVYQVLQEFQRSIGKLRMGSLEFNPRTVTFKSNCLSFLYTRSNRTRVKSPNFPVNANVKWGLKMTAF